MLRIVNIGSIIKKFLLITCVLMLTLTQLSGCYDARGIEDLAYVTALGIDITENNMLSLTFQISIPESGSDSGSSQSSKTENTTVECSSINSGISLVNSYISKQINLSHCKVIVFSEEIASKGLDSYIDTLSNNVEIRPDCNVIISRGTAKDFIENAKPSIETLTARYYEVALKSSEYTGYTTYTTFATFVNDVKNSFVQANAILGGINNGENKVDEQPYVGVDVNYKADETPIKDENNMETFGTAVFRDDKFVGELTGFETLCFLIITGKLENCTISVPSPFVQEDFQVDKQIDLAVRESKNPKISVDLSNGTPNITVNVFLEAHGLTLNETVDYTSIENVEKLEESANKYLQSKFTEFLYKTSTEFNSDIVGFGKYALSKYLTWDEWMSSDWGGNYKNSTFNVNVNLSVISGSELDKSP